MKEVPLFLLIRKKSSISDEFDDMKIEKRRQKRDTEALKLYKQSIFTEPF